MSADRAKQRDLRYGLGYADAEIDEQFRREDVVTEREAVDAHIRRVVTHAVDRAVARAVLYLLAAFAFGWWWAKQ